MLTPVQCSRKSIHIHVLTETGIEFDVPVGEKDTLGKVDDKEEGVTWGNHPACKFESAIMD